MQTDMYCYLPSGTKKNLPTTAAFDEWLDPERSAVACIDMHRGHIGPEEALTCPAPRARTKIPAHNLFHSLCRKIDVPIIHVQHWQRFGGIDGAHPRKHRNAGENWRHIYELYLPPNPIMEQHSWEGTKWLDILIEEEPERDYYVRTKKRMSSFYPTDFEFLLSQLGVDNLILTGTYTEACVLSTAFDAGNRDFRVVVPRDIVAGESEHMEDGALRIIAAHLGLVVDSPALLREWYARKGEPLPDMPDEVDDISTVAGSIPTGV